MTFLHAKYSRENFKAEVPANNNKADAISFDPFWDRPEFKKAADDNWNVAIKGLKIQIENVLEKGEIAHFELFHLFPQCFPKAFLFNMLK